jgi:hypothetical protein
MKMGNMLHFEGVISHASPPLVSGLHMMFGSWLSIKMTITLSPPTTDDIP